MEGRERAMGRKADTEAGESERGGSAVDGIGWVEVMGMLCSGEGPVDGRLEEAISSYLQGRSISS